MSFWKATPQKVGSLVRGVLGSAPFSRRASDMAKAMAREDGTGLATRRLELLVAGDGRRSAEPGGGERGVATML
jgi:hypothetical protein